MWILNRNYTLLFNFSFDTQVKLEPGGTCTRKLGAMYTRPSSKIPYSELVLEQHEGDAFVTEYAMQEQCLCVEQYVVNIDLCYLVNRI